MRLYVDDIREKPDNCTHVALSVNMAKRIIELAEKANDRIEFIDLDHDLGDWAYDGGDAIKLLDWLVERGTLYPIKIHTSNPVGRANMERMIERYWN